MVEMLRDVMVTAGHMIQHQTFSLCHHVINNFAI